MAMSGPKPEPVNIRPGAYSSPLGQLEIREAEGVVSVSFFPIRSGKGATFHFDKGGTFLNFTVSASIIDLPPPRQLIAEDVYITCVHLGPGYKEGVFKRAREDGRTFMCLCDECKDKPLDESKVGVLHKRIWDIEKLVQVVLLED